MAKKNEDAPEAVAARDREPTPEGQRDQAVAEQIALDAGQVPGPAGAPEGSGTQQTRELTDGVGSTDL